MDSVFGSRAATIEVLEKGSNLFETIRNLISIAHDKVDGSKSPGHFGALKNLFDTAHFLLLENLRRNKELDQIVKIVD